MIKVMLVENDAFWIENLSEDLNRQEGIALVNVVQTKEEAIEYSSANELDVILMDINLTENNLDGIEAAEHISKTGIRIIMLTSLNDREIILEAIESGAINYINKANYKDMIKAIYEAYENKASLHSDVSEILRQELIQTKIKLRYQSLSPSELEVLELKQKGLNRIQIAEKLQKSQHTIKNQWKKVREKLKLKGGDY